MNRRMLCGMLVLAIGCSSTGEGGGGGAGGGAKGGAGGSPSGSGGSGGVTSSGTGGSTTGAGGAAGGASGGSGGTSSGGAGGGGGSASGGSGGSGNPDGGTPGPATPSAGCSKGTARPANGTVTMADTYYLGFPTSYDGKTPMPVLIGLHGCGSGNRGTSATSTEWMNLTKGTGFETDYIRAVPVSTDSGGCWTSSGDMARVTSMYDDLLANYCVDTSRVFGTGHSSGAQFLVQKMLAMKTAYDHFKLKGVSPVAADPATLAGPMPVMYIDGKMDNQRSATSATNTVKDFRTANMCADTSKTYTPVMSCMSTDSGHPLVDPGCIIYDSCKVPTIWCSHNDPSYGGTEHGVPCFAMKAMYDFFKTLP